jgi:hypothetical protein
MMRAIPVGPLTSWMVAALLLPVAALAQPPTQDFTALPELLRPGQAVIVTATDGTDRKGRIAELSPSSLVILTPDRQVYGQANVRRIRRTDSVWNGVLIGAAVGGAVAAIGYAGTRGHSDAVYGWAYIGSWLAPAGGAVAGALIDRASNRTIYVAPPATSRSGPTPSQDLEPRRHGLQVSARF